MLMVHKYDFFNQNLCLEPYNKQSKYFDFIRELKYGIN